MEDCFNQPETAPVFKPDPLAGWLRNDSYGWMEKGKSPSRKDPTYAAAKPATDLDIRKGPNKKATQLHGKIAALSRKLLQFSNKNFPPAGFAMTAMTG